MAKFKFEKYYQKRVMVFLGFIYLVLENLRKFLNLKKVPTFGISSFPFPQFFVMPYSEKFLHFEESKSLRGRGILAEN